MRRLKYFLVAHWLVILRWEARVLKSQTQLNVRQYWKAMQADREVEETYQALRHNEPKRGEFL